jgi:hypothetical protein
MNILTHLARGAKRVLAPLALAALAACTSSFNADVSRFESQLPAPAGQTFTVVATDPALANGIEFRMYAQKVADHLAALGYTPVDSEGAANLIVRFDYGVDNGRERVRSTGMASDPWWGPWYGYRPYYRGYARPYYSPWAWGWNSGWWGGNEVRSYTIYTSGIELKIDRAADGQRLFEGRAQAVSTSNRLQWLVPNLVDAMFTGFPGNSGETVRISIAPEDEGARRNGN